MGVKDDLRQRYDSLSPALQQVAKHVLDHPNEVVTSSMRSVGTRAWIMVLLGRDQNDPLFLQFKEAQDSVLEPFLGKSSFNSGKSISAGLPVYARNQVKAIAALLERK